MKRLVAKIFILVMVMLGSITADAANVTANTCLRIEKLSTPTITIGSNKLKQGDTFSAGDKIEWADSKQSMVVRDLSSHALMRYSKRTFEKKGAVKSIHDFLVKVNKGSTRGGNYHIVLDKSDKAALFPEKRIALVVGNQNYMYLAPLKSAQKDAEDIASTLSDLGFDVMELYETDYSELMEGLNKFSGLAKNYDVALFYYAGHGIQEEGVNYLVPVDNMLDRINDLRDCVSCNEVVQKVEDSGCTSKIFYFDACRDRKTTWSRSSLNGLSPMEGAIGTVITFATQSGKVAADGDRDGNSPFAEMLIKNIKEPKLSFSEMADLLVRDTYNATNPHQNPVRVGSLIQDFCFNPLTPSDKKKEDSPYRTPIYRKARELDNEGKYEEAMQMYLKEKNNPWCQVNIGVLYADGHGVAQDYKKAFEWYKKAADQGDEVAMRNIGQLYWVGNGFPKNCDEAMKWFKLAVEKGDVNAMMGIAACYTDPDYKIDYDEYRKWLNKAIDTGNEYAMFVCGEDYFYGIRGAKQNYIKAYEWFSKAAEKNSPEAQHELANMYYWGKGMEKDYEQAYEWYFKSASQGYAKAQNMIGFMYENGLYVDKDENTAMSWYRKAAEQDNEVAQYNLASMYYNGKGVEKDYKQAYEWLLKSASQGYAYAQNMIGFMYEKGLYVGKDENTAISWYRKAAEQGDGSALSSLAVCYLNGRGVEVDCKKAFEYASEAADKGDSLGEYLVGLCYYYGEGVKVDKVKAKEWMEKAAASGNEDAKEFLAEKF